MVKSKEYIETDTGNKISRLRTTILGSQNIILGGKTVIQSECTIRGDLRRFDSNSDTIAIIIGKYSFIAVGTVIRPPSKIHQGVFNYYPMRIGDFVQIGEGSMIEAASIGSYVKIGKECVIGKFCIIKDCVEIREGTILPEHSVIPSFSIVEGKPGLVIEELPECTQELFEKECRTKYHEI
ncbi:hypothetical protein T552_01349 [Pneumocystis carinii B80]|uniref:Dynactin subunit 5 n=1 Tax=Pneumocystis carinii (strain B80) TaxID=1408658 RepID=A0A0W4ZM12_PNEC8|nr:hypothetical protein T552_01349 [Pneumocystis carinii B80]KTW29396.1 hypothetical protein T552_01349 [Pneumocystis carinii B80]